MLSSSASLPLSARCGLVPFEFKSTALIGLDSDSVQSAQSDLHDSVSDSARGGITISSAGDWTALPPTNVMVVPFSLLDGVIRRLRSNAQATESKWSTSSATVR